MLILIFKFKGKTFLYYFLSVHLSPIAVNKPCFKNEDVIDIY